MRPLIAIVAAAAALLSAAASRAADCRADRAMSLGCTPACARAETCKSSECLPILEECNRFIASNEGTRCGNYCKRNRDNYQDYTICHRQCMGQKVPAAPAKSAGRCQADRATALGCTPACARAGTCRSSDCFKLLEECNQLVQANDGTRCGDYCKKSRKSYADYDTCIHQCNAGPSPKKKAAQVKKPTVTKPAATQRDVVKPAAKPAPKKSAQDH